MRVAVVLAGSRSADDPVAASQGKPLKAFVRVGGAAMIDHVLKTLQDADCFEKILVCIPKEDYEKHAPVLFSMRESGFVQIIAPEGSPARSVLKAVDRAEGKDILLTTADHPLLSVDMIRLVLDHKGGDVAVGMVPLKLIQEKYPNSKRTKMPFKDGAHSGCNLFVFRANEKAIALVSYWIRMETLRKHPMKMAWTIGPLFLLRFILRQLSVQDVFDTIGTKAGAQITAVMLDAPEAGIDVDKVEDLALVDEIFKQV